MRIVALLLISAALIAADQPNVLFVIADDWGRGDASAYGSTWIKTPAFDRVAREGLLFSRAYTPNAKCSPSRACVLTGRNPWELGAAANHIPFFPSEFTTWPEALTRLGFHVGATGKGWAPGVANDAQGNKRAMVGRTYGKRSTKPPTKAIGSNDYAGNFSDFLDEAKPGQPWVFWCGMTEPHRDYEYGTGVKLGGKKISDIPRVPGYWPDTDVVRNDLLDYAFEVEYVDSHLARMLADLEKRGVLDDTLIIVTSDNGMPFPRVKGHTYDVANHLPFAVRWGKGVSKPGVVIDDLVSFIDLAPTVLDVLNVTHSASGMAPITGRSLVPIFTSGRGGRIVPERDHVLLGRERNDIGRPGDAGYPVRGIVTADRLLLINYEPTRWPACDPLTGYLDTDGSPTKTAILDLRRSGGEPLFWQACFGKRPAVELYDLSRDTDCLTNLATTHVMEVDVLTRRLETRLRAEGDRRQDGRGGEYDAFPHATFEHQGFYERFQQGEKLKAGWVSPTDFEREALE
jgi:N-sulfoglucosamine sulfohydrolase